MKKILETVMLFLFVFTYTNKVVFGISIDSLQIIIKRLPEDTIKVNEFNDLSEKYIKNQIDSSFFFAKKAVCLSKNLKYTYGYARSLKQLGLVYKYRSEYDSALFYYQKSLQLFDSLKINSERASVLNRMANIYKRKADYNKTLECYYSALDISLSINDSILISALYNNISIFYKNINRYNEALEYQLMNLNIIRKLGLNNDLVIALMNIGNIYKEKMDYSQALNYYGQALKLFNDNNKYDKVFLLHNIGVVYELTKRYDAAKQYYTNAIKVEKEIGNKDMLVLSLQGMGNVLVITSHFREGEKYLLESFRLVEELGDLKQLANLAKSLQNLYELNSQYQKSLEYYHIYNYWKDSLFNIEGKKQIIFLEQKFEAEKRKQQIAFLEKEHAIQKLELSKKRIETKQKSFQRNVLILILILILIFTLYLGKESKKRKRISQLLIKQNKKITEQRSEIEIQNKELVESNKTKDRLFQIIAHDLRSPLVSIDSITQLIPYWVEEQDYESLKKLSTTLELSVNNVLSLIDNLLNWALNQQGKFPYKPENLRLKENIHEAIEIYRSIAKMKNIELKFASSKDVMVFADKNMLCSVMRNLLNNAVKFTPDKGEIVVGIDSNQQFAKVWVKDSGIGIPKEKSKMVFELANAQGKGTKGETGNGLGLFFCKEFVMMNNGDIFIESEKGKGTTITFTLPLLHLAEN